VQHSYHYHIPIGRLKRSLGLAIARALAKEGANVKINGMGETAAIEAERAVRRHGGLFGRRHDEAGRNPRHGEGSRGEARLGDILVNNARVQHVADRGISARKLGQIATPPRFMQRPPRSPT
jgi:hypothetical protein